MRCIISRRCVTGEIQYRAMHGGDCISRARAAVLPGFPVEILCRNRVLRFRRDPERTVFPGRSEPIFDGEGVCGRVVCQEYGRHRIELEDSVLQVFFRSGAWRFFQGNRLVGILEPAEPESAEQDWEIRQVLRTFGTAGQEWQPVMAHFPLLQIGI